jgi:sugar phosphate isomerase/epimerase
MKICAFADEAANDIRGQIAALERNGISLLEIRHIDGINISDISAEHAREVRKMLDFHGIKVWSIGSPIGKYPLSEPFAPHLNTFMHTTELAEILGAAKIRLFSFFTKAEADAEREKEEVLLRMRALCESAPQGLSLCHENEKEIFGDTIVNCLALHRELPRLRAVFDPANFVQCGEDADAAFTALAPYIEYMHAKDARQDGANVLAGDGAGKLPLILKRFADIGGEVVTLEPHLKKFTGLAGLENGKKTAHGSYSFATLGEAFDAAAQRLIQLIEENEREQKI